MELADYLWMLVLSTCAVILLQVIARSLRVLRFGCVSAAVM